jgi:hypothetical protein
VQNVGGGSLSSRSGGTQLPHHSITSLSQSFNNSNADSASSASIGSPGSQQQQQQQRLTQQQLQRLPQESGVAGASFSETQTFVTLTQHSSNVSVADMRARRPTAVPDRSASSFVTADGGGSGLGEMMMGVTDDNDIGASASGVYASIAQHAASGYNLRQLRRNNSTGSQAQGPAGGSDSGGGGSSQQTLAGSAQESSHFGAHDATDSGVNDNASFNSTMLLTRANQETVAAFSPKFASDSDEER